MIEIKRENAPDLRNITTQKLFDYVSKNAHIKITNLSNWDIKLYINQRLRGGGNSQSTENVNKVKNNEKVSDKNIDFLSNLITI